MNYRLLTAALLATALSAAAIYEINFPDGTLIADKSARHIDAVGLNSPANGEQQVAVDQATDGLLYHDLSSTANFTVTAGETVSPIIGWSGTWMGGYLYVDYNNDGAFDPATELVSYSFYGNKNSHGETTTPKADTPRIVTEMPTFNVPSFLTPGTYRIRYKVDWDSNDPGGRNGEANKITDNNGAIVDATMTVKAAASAETGDYAVNFPADAQITHASRRLTSLTLSAEGMPAQTLKVGQNEDLLLTHDLTKGVIVAPAGATVNVSYDWSGVWMNSYVYLDMDNNGVFSTDTLPGGTTPYGCELLSYSYYKGKNSTGATLSDGDVVVPPAFKIPAALKPGTYRMRVKIDWDNLDPAGNNGESNDILTNGGAITDFTLWIPEAIDNNLTVNAENGTLNQVETADGKVGFEPVADEGYYFDGLTVKGGFTLPAGFDYFACAALSGETAYPADDMTDGMVLVAPESLLGNAVVTGIFIPTTEAPKGGKYESAMAGAANALTSLTVNGREQAVPAAAHATLPSAYNVPAGAELTFAAGVADAPAKWRLFIDANQDGEFYHNTTSLNCEEYASAATPEALTYTLPSTMTPAVYRARLEAEGKSDVDFLLNVYAPTANYTSMALNAIILNGDAQPMRETVAPMTALDLTIKTSCPGFDADSIIVRHGQNLNGPEFITGNRQWADTKLKLKNSGKITIPDTLVNGDITVYALFEERESSKWTKVWGDEFSSNKMSATRWQYQDRSTATWNRYVAQGYRQQRETNKFEEGYYNAYCMPTPSTITDESNPMISGAINSWGIFDMTYGRVEARIKTNPYIGNFPAFWMMPSAAAPEVREIGLAGWPNDGEIDIWEQIDAENKAHHTVHSAWTGWKLYNNWPTAPQQGSPTSSGNEYVDASLWHVYTLDWDEETLRWYVDGNLAFTYANQHYSEPDVNYYSTERITWPFDKHFYIILNQSVGNGSWAKNPDYNHTYKTSFDYVRVYQKKDGSQTNVKKISGNGDDPEFYVPALGYDPEFETTEAIDNVIFDAPEGPTVIYDLNGRRVDARNLRRGIYIERCGNESRKFLVK